MLNVSENLKNILRNDSFPVSDTVTPKDLEIIFDGMEPIYADKIVDDSFELTESIIDDADIRFGTCRASQIKFKLADVKEDIKGKEFTINLLIDGGYSIPLGKYKVHSAKLEDDLIFKEVIAYDKLKDTDVDVSEWYNGLFPTGGETYTLKAFRSSLLAHLGIEEVEQVLPNDDMLVERTIEPSQISGRTVLEATVELNGAFGHINRQGKFTRIVLQPSYGLYPSETLYPSNNLYPVSETDISYVQEDIIDDTISKAMYESVRFEEYTVKEIDKLQIRAEEHDIGAIVGTGSNAYVIEGNFLVFGKSPAELEQIAISALGNMAKRPYRPYEAQSIGLPYVEVGDALQINTDDTVVGYVLQRTLTGIQALKDNLESPGSEEREQNFGVNKEIIQLLGKSTKIQKDVEGVRVEVEDLAQDTASKFTQTAEQITAEVTRATEAEEDLRGSIGVLAGQVVLKVGTNGNIGYVELDADPDTEMTSIKLGADNIELEGITTINDGFKVLEDGTIEAVDGKFSGTITGSTIYGTEFLSSNWDGNTHGTWFNELTINGGEIRLGRTMYAPDGRTYEGQTTLSSGLITTYRVRATEIGAYNNYTSRGYFTRIDAGQVYLNGEQLVSFKNNNVTAIYTPNKLHYIHLNDSRELLPSTFNSTTPYSLGNRSYPFRNIYADYGYITYGNIDYLTASRITHKSGGTLGFFGRTPTSINTVTKLSASANAEVIARKVNELLDALGNTTGGYGLIKLS